MSERSTITAEEAARILGVSKSTITRLIQRGELEAYKLTLGQTSPLRIYEDSVEEFMQRRHQKPAS